MDKALSVPEWVKLIPADAIPVFCFGADTLDNDLERASHWLVEFFGAGELIVIRGNVDIYAIAVHDGVSAEGASWAMEGRTHDR